jgi:hypothetical protein
MIVGGYGIGNSSKRLCKIACFLACFKGAFPHKNRSKTTSCHSKSPTPSDTANSCERKTLLIKFAINQLNNFSIKKTIVT